MMADLNDRFTTGLELLYIALQDLQGISLKGRIDRW